MDKQLQALQQNLESAVQRADDEGIEFWFARNLQVPPRLRTLGELPNGDQPGDGIL